MSLLALALTAAAPACLFAPDPCTDLLQCGGGKGGTSGTSGNGGQGGTGGVVIPVTISTGFTTLSGIILDIPCMKDETCQGTATPTCDPVMQICRDCSTEDCRAPVGSACSEDGACVSGRCVMGKCSACSANAQCATMLCAGAACKAPSGAPCGADEDCLGGECRFGLCKINIGHPCGLPVDCFTGVCKAGACQGCFDDADCPGTACGTGKQLGRCLLPPGSGCWPDSQMIVSCFSGACVGFPATCQ